ncbi:hypothetical protein FB479_10364 [Brevibacillus sp. AG162]|nr:hypothetical protein FB479_10364 [Brevibacillus sp. AG162]
MTVANYGMTVAVPLGEVHHLRVAVVLPPDTLIDIDGVIDEGVGVTADVHFETHEEGRQLIKRRPFHTHFVNASTATPFFFNSRLKVNRASSLFLHSNMMSTL